MYKLEPKDLLTDQAPPPDVLQTLAFDNETEVGPPTIPSAQGRAADTRGSKSSFRENSRRLSVRSLTMSVGEA